MSHSYLDYGKPFMELYSLYIFLSSENEKMNVNQFRA